MRLEIDHAQPRIARDRIGIALTMPALAGDVSTRSGTWVCPANDCLTLLPGVAEPAYLTSSTGKYAKLGLTDFGSPSGWIEADVSGSGNLKLLQKPDGGTIQTTATWPKNTPFVIHFHNYAVSGGDERIVIEGGWSNSPGVEDDTSFRITTSGKVEIWRAGILIVEGKISTPSNQLCTVLLIPCRGRELAVVGPSGGAFTAIFGDIAEGDESPAITPEAKFFLTGYGTASMLATPMLFATSGTALSLPISLGEAPDEADEREIYDYAPWIGGNGNARIYGSSPYRGSSTAYASVVALGGGTFTEDGVTRDVRVLTTLTGDGYSSPFLWGMKAGWRGTTEMTAAAGEDGAGIDITRFLVGYPSIEVPDGGPARLTFTLKAQRYIPPPEDDPEAPATTEDLADVIDRPSIISNRPVRFFPFDDGHPIFDGVTGVPQYTRTSFLEADRLSFECLDLEAELQTYTFAEPLIFDGYKVCRTSDPSAVRLILRRVYPLDRLQLSDSDAEFGDIPPQDTSEFSATADTNESADDALDRVTKEGLGLWLRGWRPNAGETVYVVESPEEQLARAPFCTLYGTVAEAEANGYDDGRKGVWRDLVSHRSPAEANVVNVVGRDPRTNLPVRSIKRDDPARDPTLAPNLRPDNWLGSLRRYGTANRGLIGQQATNDATELMFDRLTPIRRIVEFGCDLPFNGDGVPLWRGNKVTLDGIGDFVVASLRIDFTIDDGAETDRRTIYRCRVVATDQPAGTRGLHGDEIASAAWGDARRGGIVRRRSGMLTAKVADVTAVLS